MDPRVRLAKALRDEAEDAFVIRNGGGRVTDDVVRSLVLCSGLLQVTEVAVLHHTDCRLQAFTNDEIALRTGVNTDFLAFSDPVASVLADVSRLKGCGLLPPEVNIWGGLYSVESHTVSVVVAPARRGAA